MKRIALLCSALLYLFAMPSAAQVSVGENGTFSGQVYTDYYWMAQHHNDDIEAKNGFWFRRIYATYEHALSDAFSTRLRLEMNSAGDFTTSAEMIPNVKDAYLKWQNDGHQILAGISSTPTWGLVEDVWGYRSVEKSPLDLYDFGSSRDMGVSFKGNLGPSNKVSYHFFFGNGNSNRPEIDKGKKLMLALGYQPTEHLVVQGYLDWNDSADNPNETDSQTAQLFASYQSDDLNIGALYAYQHRNPLVGGSDVNLDLISIFGSMSITSSVNGFLRVDHLFDPYMGGSGNSYIPFAETAESTFLVGGADIKLEDNISLMPNVEAIVYGDPAFGATPDTDIIPRLTLVYEF